MNQVVERPTSLIKPPLPGKPYIDNLNPRNQIGASFNRKVKLFEELGHEDAENKEDLSPLRHRQPKAITPEQKRWTQIESTENSSVWISAPNVSPRIGGSCKQKTLPPTPSPRLLSPASPNRLSPTTFAPKQEKESDVKKTPKPKPRARSSFRSSGLILDTDTSVSTSRTSPSSHHPPSPVSPVPSPRKSLGFTEGINQISPSSYKPPPTIPHRRNSKEPNRTLRPVYYTPPPELHYTREKNFSGDTDHSASSLLQSQPPSVQNHRNLKIVNEKLNNQTHRTLPNTTQKIPVNDHNMAFNKDFRLKPRKPRALTQFDNVTYDAFITSNDAQRPRARTDLTNGKAGVVDDDDDDKRMSVLELAQSFGQLKHLKSERPKTYGAPFGNGHSNKITKSNPDLLSDDSLDSPVENGGYPGKIARSNPDLLNDGPAESSAKNGRHSGRVSNGNPDLLNDDCERRDVWRSRSPPQQEVQLGKLERRRSKSLSEFNLIDMPPMDPTKYTHGGKVKQTKSAAPPSRPQTGQLRPASMVPAPVKPKRTYEHDEYVLRKSMKGLPRTGGHSGVAQTKSAAPAVRVMPLAIHPAINAKKRHVYDDVHVERFGEEEEETAADQEDNMTKTKEYLPISPKYPGSSAQWKTLPPEVSPTSSKVRPASAMSAISKSPKPRRGILQRSARIERSHSHEDLLKVNSKISGEYANPEIAMMSKNKRQQSRRKPEYSEPYLHRSSSDDSLYDKRQTHPPVEDSEGYSVPGSHLWSQIPDGKEEERKSQAIVALRNVMRQKIQSAFSRTKISKVEEDAWSQTSEDSDIDLNDSVLKKRLTHVRAVRRRTSAYCSLEWYRKTMQYDKLYEYVVVVSLNFNKETRRHEPCEIRRFPHEISDSQSDKLRAIPLFCFPDAFKWAKVEQYNSESYSFVLTSVDGSRLYGYNRRLLPPGDGPRLPEVYCVMSPIGCAPVYNELLDEIEKRRQVSMQAVELLLRTARDNPFPRPGERLRIKMPSQPITKPLIIHRPTDSRLEQMNFQCLFDSLDVAKVIQVFASLLLERRVVMCSSKLSKLSSCSQAIAALLYPFAWQHVYVPVLPEKLIDMCCSPTPYIMGMLSLCIPKLDEMPGIDEVIVVDLDSRDFYFLVGDEETILPKKLYAGLQRALSFVEKGSAENINDVASLEDPDSQNAMISEAFIHFFVETVGHYSNHFSQHFDGTLKFDRDGFLNAVKSRSTRRFLEVFTETQMFSLFIQEKETESEGICQGLFERRVKLFEREKANNATFSTKMKKIVKDSGNRLAETAKDVKAKVKVNISNQV